MCKGKIQLSRKKSQKDLVFGPHFVFKLHSIVGEALHVKVACFGGLTWFTAAKQVSKHLKFQTGMNLQGYAFSLFELELSAQGEETEIDINKKGFPKQGKQLEHSSFVHRTQVKDGKKSGNYK